MPQTQLRHIQNKPQLSADSSDRDLVASLQGTHHSSTKESAAAIIFERYNKLLYSLASQYLRDHARRDDLVQEVFKKVFQEPESFDLERNFKTWICAVAHHKAVDFLRRDKARYKIEGITGQGSAKQDDGIDLIKESCEPSGLESSVSQDERVNRTLLVQGVLARIPDPYRVLLDLSARDVSYGAMSEITGVTLGTVKSRLFTARSLFKRLYAEELKQAA